MKIRTDFVTNSSSSSFIAIKVNTADKAIAGELDSGNVAIIPENGGYFNITEADLKSASDIKQVLEIMCKWFYATLEDPSCWDEVNPTWSEEDFEGEPSLRWEDCRQVLKYYGRGEFEDLLSIKMGEVQSINFFSRMEYWDEPYGACLIEYDRASRQMHITEPDDHGFGDKLKDLFDYRLPETYVSDEMRICDRCGDTVPENDMFDAIVNNSFCRLCKSCVEAIFGKQSEDEKDNIHSDTFSGEGEE